MGGRARDGNQHWMPPDAHGWYRCQVQIVGVRGVAVYLTCDLWWNEDALGSGWFGGQPGDCLSLEDVFAAPKVLMGVRTSVP